MTGDLKLKSDARIHLTILNADGTPRLYIFKDKDGDGVHINNANDGGGDFVFNKDGGFYAPSYLHAGNAYMQGDGNIWGTVWNPSGGWLWEAIVEQLNTRGTIDWINNQLSIRDRNINTRAAISQVIGIGQTYRVVTNKFLGVTYTNTSQKPWVVVLKINLPTSGEVQIKVNGVMAAGGNAANNAGIAVWAYPSAIVPAGATYVVESAWGNVIQWVELQ